MKKFIAIVIAASLGLSPLSFANTNDVLQTVPGGPLQENVSTKPMQLAHNGHHFKRCHYRCRYHHHRKYCKYVCKPRHHHWHHRHHHGY